MIPVILSGGSGSRLWPLSRKQFPKQFLALTGEHTLFQQTLERLVFEGMDSPIVVCNKDHRFIVNEQLAARKLESQRILMEPFGRNTAPAVALTAMMLVNEGRDELMLVLPADHVIDDQKALQRAGPGHRGRRAWRDGAVRRAGHPSGNRLWLHQVHQRFAAARRREPRRAVRGKTQ